MKSPLLGYFSACFWATTAFAQAPEVQDTSDDTWVDQQHSQVRGALHRWSNAIDNWIDTPDPAKPASANLRIMLDNEWNRYDGYSLKPRVRAKIRLPALKRRFSLVVGDDDLDNQARDKHQLHRNYDKPLENGRKYDREQSRSDNSSIALRFSTEKKRLGIETDLDLGIRAISDLFVRAKASKKWQITERFSTRFEQIYRFGIQSRHYIRSNLENRFVEDERRSLNNHTYYQYVHDGDQKKHWGNSSYRQHNYNNFKQLNYGFNFGGEVRHKKFKINYYGPFINWRQPISRKWLFIQPEIHFYNNKAESRSHNLGAFLRLEVVL